jgi:hypothetical protein
MAGLPEWQAYRNATYPTFFAALADLFKSARASCALPPPGEDRWFQRLGEEIASRGADRPAGEMSLGRSA